MKRFILLMAFSIGLVINLEAAESFTPFGVDVGTEIVQDCTATQTVVFNQSTVMSKPTGYTFSKMTESRDLTVDAFIYKVKPQALSTKSQDYNTVVLETGLHQRGTNYFYWHRELSSKEISLRQSLSTWKGHNSLNFNRYLHSITTV